MLNNANLSTKPNRYTYSFSSTSSDFNYYSFGSLMGGRQYSSGTGYRYGFNGKENDNEVSGNGNKLDFGARIFDSRLGRWLACDPLEKKYPSASPYNYALNTPIQAVDPDGNVVIFINGQHTNNGVAGNAKYWEGVVKLVMEQIGDDKALYFDGSEVCNVGGFGNTVGSAPIPIADVYCSNLICVNRMRAGTSLAKANAQSIIDNLEEGESIKIVTHSMGGAFAKGYVKGLKNYAKKNNIEINIEFEVDLAPYQPNQQSAVDGVPTTQLSHYGDIVANPLGNNGEVDGARVKYTRPGKPKSIEEHGVASFKDEIKKYVPKSTQNGNGKLRYPKAEERSKREIAK